MSALARVGRVAQRLGVAFGGLATFATSTSEFFFAVALVATAGEDEPAPLEHGADDEPLDLTGVATLDPAGYEMIDHPRYDTEPPPTEDEPLIGSVEARARKHTFVV